MHKMRLIMVLLIVLLAMALFAGGCADNRGETEYVYVDELPALRITAEALKVIAESSGPYTLTYTARTS